MKILICGTRKHTAQRLYLLVIEAIRDAFDPMFWYALEVIHGDCPDSPDQFAVRLGVEYPQVRVEAFPANWSRGRGAGFERNSAMLDEKPELVIAVWDGRSGGTLDTIRKATQRGIPVRVIPTELPEHSEEG